MPPIKRIEASVYIVDCNSDVENRLNILYRLQALKYFRQTSGQERDLQKIILYNHPGLRSKHIVNDWMFYSIELLQTIKEQIANANQSCRPHNFLYILNGAVEAFEDDSIKPDYVKRIVFITDLSSNMDFDENTDNKIDFIKTDLKDNNIWIYVIGLNVKLPRLYNQSEICKLNMIEPRNELSPEQKRNYDVLSRFDENVAFVDEENGINVVLAHIINPKGANPWYVNMNIGPDLEIPVAVSRTTRSHEKIKFHPSSTDVGISCTKVWYDTNTHERVQLDDVVRGYKYQGRFITNIPPEEKPKTEKCLTIFGFASADEVPLNLFLMPDTINTVKPDRRGQESAADRRFELFATSLRVKNSVALVYRVYNRGYNKKLFCIFPCPEHKHNGHLLMGQLPFKHEFHEGFYRGKVEEDNYTSDTYNLMKEFLHKLSPVDNDVELYPLPPSMQVSGNRARMTEFLCAKALGNDPGKAPEISMHPVIENRASQDIDALLKECLLN